MKKPTLSKQFGERLRELRRRKGLSLEALGDRAGLNAKFIQAVEVDRQAPTLHTIEKLARGLDVPPSELFVFDDESPAALRSRVKRWAATAEDRDLAKIVRLLEAALH